MIFLLHNYKRRAPARDLLDAGDNSTFLAPYNGAIIHDSILGCRKDFRLLTRLPNGAGASGNPTITGGNGSSTNIISTATTTPQGTNSLVFLASACMNWNREVCREATLTYFRSNMTLGGLGGCQTPTTLITSLNFFRKISTEK